MLDTRIAFNAAGGRYKLLSKQADDPLRIIYDAFDHFTGAAVQITGHSKRRGTAAYPLTRLRSDASYSEGVVHPSITHVINQYEDETKIYIVTPFSEIAPLSTLPADDLPRDPMAFFKALRTLLYVVEYYHSNNRPGCFLLPGSVRLARDGDVLVDTYLDCRLRYFSQVNDKRITPMLEDKTATAEDIRCLGRTMALLLDHMPDSRGEPVEDEVLTTRPNLTFFVEALQLDRYPTIQAATAAFRRVEEDLNKRLRVVAPKFSAGSRRVKLAAGETLFKEGDPSNGKAYVVEGGVLQILKKGGDGRETQLDLSKAGDIVGEMALIDRAPRMATARAVEATTLLVIDGSELESRLASLDLVSRKLITVLSSRLRQRGKEVAQLKALIGSTR